jgi:hypothetical protein
LQNKVLDNPADGRIIPRMASIYQLRPRASEQPPVEPPSLHSRAMDNLRFIRETMERAASFTAVPGWGAFFMGLTALVATFIAAQQTYAKPWLETWLVEAFVALLIGGWAMDRKARRQETSLLSGPARKFILGLTPPILVGALLTFVFFRAGMMRDVPGMWLLLYGTGVITGGAFSVRIVPIMGLSFMILGVFSLFSPASWGNIYMGVGFCLLHVIFGIIIARRHGG